jgi:hypothetical protein
MDVPSYHQLLAEQYEENAKNLLVFQKEYDDEDGDVDHYTRQNYENHELEEPETFNQFHGDRGTAKMVIPTKDFEDKTRGSVRYDKDVKTHIVDIDSRFRSYPKANFPSYTSLVPGGPLNTYPASNPANFLFALPRIIKNVISIQVTSISFPNVFYTFSAARENTTFYVYDENGVPFTQPPATTQLDPGQIVIDDGNHTLASLVLLLDTKVKALTSNSIEVIYDANTNKITFKRLNGRQFGLNFKPQTIREPYNNGMGYNLGFEQYKYGTAPYDSATEPVPTPLQLTDDGLLNYFAKAETFPDVLGDSYIYLAINDYDIIEHQNFKQSFFPVFAKLMLPHNSKNTLITDVDLLYTVQRPYNFTQPVNISKFEITVYDAYGNVLDLGGANFSFTLKMEEVLNPALYEKMRDL